MPGADPSEIGRDRGAGRADRVAAIAALVPKDLRAVSHVTRGENETADIHLKGRPETLPVSRTYLHLFKQM